MPITPRMLRDAISEALWEAMSAAEIQRFCTAVGLPPPVSDDEAYASKRRYVNRRLEGMPTTQLTHIGRYVLDEYDSTTESARLLVGTLAGWARGARRRPRSHRCGSPRPARRD